MSVRTDLDTALNTLLGSGLQLTAAKHRQANQMILDYIDQVFGGTLPAPTISGFLPIQGAQGSTVVITGTGFTGATLVSVNSGSVASFVLNSPTQITAVLSNAQSTGLVRVTTPNGTGVSASPFTVTTGSGLASYMPANANWADGKYAESYLGGTARNTLSSVSGTTSATQVQVQFIGDVNQIGFNTQFFGVRLNGTYYPYSFTSDGTLQTISLTNLPSGSYTLEIILPDLIAGGSSGFIAAVLRDVQANSAITWATPSAPVNRGVILGDSILSGADGNVGGVDRISGGWVYRVRSGFATASTTTRLTVDSFSGGTLLQYYGPSANRTANLARLFAQCNGTVKNVVVLEYGTNDSVGAQLFQDTYDLLVTDILANPLGVLGLKVVLQTPTVRTDSKETDYLVAVARPAIRNVAAAHPTVDLLEGVSIVDLANINPPVHPNNAGHIQLAAAYSTKLGDLFGTTSGTGPGYNTVFATDFDGPTSLPSGFTADSNYVVVSGEQRTSGTNSLRIIAPTVSTSARTTATTTNGRMSANVYVNTGAGVSYVGVEIGRQSNGDKYQLSVVTTASNGESTFYLAKFSNNGVTYTNLAASNPAGYNYVLTPGFYRLSIVRNGAGGLSGSVQRLSDGKYLTSGSLFTSDTPTSFVSIVDSSPLSLTAGTGGVNGYFDTNNANNAAYYDDVRLESYT